MARLNIDHLALPARRFRSDKVQGSKFETRNAVRAEDLTRAKMLRKYATSPISPQERRKANRLADALSEDLLAPCPASAAYMRDIRIRLIGHLWRIIVQESETPSTFTLWGRDMEVAGKDLSKVDPRAMGKALVASLYRAGAKGADGYFFGYLDAEHDPVRDVWKFHWHGQTDGSLKVTLGRLRTTRKYGRPKDLRISRKPLTNLPEPLTYLVKLFWGSRWQGKIDGKKRRQRSRSRIKEPRHSELLLWLNRWSPADLSVLVGLEVVGNQLVKTRKK